MRLVDSPLEAEIRDQLIRSCRELMMAGRPSDLAAELVRHFGRIQSAFILGHVPEQGEDVYVVLVNGDHVASCEIPRVPGGVYSPIETMHVNRYARGLKGKSANLRLLIARALAQQAGEASDKQGAG